MLCLKRHVPCYMKKKLCSNTTNRNLYEKIPKSHLFLIKNYLVKVLATAFTIATEIHMGEETA